MKKNTLFKIIAITAFVLAVLSWILPASATSGTELASLGLVRVSLYEFLYYPLLAVQFFLQPFLFVLAVGGLYGILNETGKYRNILEKIAKSLKRNSIFNINFFNIRSIKLNIWIKLITIHYNTNAMWNNNFNGI